MAKACKVRFRLKDAKYQGSNENGQRIVVVFPSTATTRILTNCRQSITDLSAKVRNCQFEIQIVARALSCQIIRGGGFADQVKLLNYYESVSQLLNY